MTINCSGKLIDFTQPKIMGILNITADSFFDGGKYLTEKEYLTQVEKMLNEGAAIIDIGGMSTRQNATIISSEKECQRVLLPIQTILKYFPEAILSIDTFYANTARAAVEAGVHIVNDISAGELDKEMIATVSQLKVPYIAMHMRGNPQTMQQLTDYVDVTKAIFDFFIHKINEIKKAGITDLVIDLGFGFSKNLAQNFELFKNIDLFQQFEKPILVGISMKSMVYKKLNIEKEMALNGTSALHMAALLKGAKILRVHDVKSAKECIDLYTAIVQ